MKRLPIVLAVLLIAGLGAAAAWLYWPRASLPEDPLAVIPADAYGVVRVRVDRVLASEAYKRLWVGRGQEEVLADVEKQCGFNPLAQLTELVVFARPAPDGGLPRLAFVARGALSHAALLDCATKLSGGDAAALTREDVEDIPTVRSKKGSSRAAFVGGDGLLGGDAESVRAALLTLRGKAPSLADEASLAPLYRELSTSSDVTLVSRLPDEAKPLIRRAAALAGPHLLQLEAVRAIGANVGTGAGRLAGGALLVMADAPQASALIALAQETKERLLAIPGVGLTPAATVLNALQTEARGERATFAGSVKVQTIESLLTLLPALRMLDDVPPTDPDARAQAEPPDAGVGASDAAPELRRVRRRVH